MAKAPTARRIPHERSPSRDETLNSSSISTHSQPPGLPHASAPLSNLSSEPAMTEESDREKSAEGRTSNGGDSEGAAHQQPTRAALPFSTREGIACTFAPAGGADGASLSPMPTPATLPTLRTQPSQGAIDGQAYILKVCRAFMIFGAPTHRLEAYMHSTANALGLSLQSFHIPGCMILSFTDPPSGSNEVHIVRCSQSLNLAKLYDVHALHKSVIHRDLCIAEANAQLGEIIDGSGRFSLWFRVLNYGLASAFIGPVSYGAHPIDLPIIFVLGAVVGFLELVLAPMSELYGYVFEISSAILVSLLGRAFGSIQVKGESLFCFSAIAQASIVMILPGFTLTTSALEIQTGNMVSGSVRIVYGIVYTLFLAFGFTIGITIYGAMDANSTSATFCPNPWPFWWQVAFVLPFTLCYIVVNQGKWKKMPAMLFVTLAGWLVNHFSNQRFASVPSLGQALGALTAGILANLMSRLGHGFAAAILHPAIFIQVPGSLAASGSLVSGVASANRLNGGGGSHLQTAPRTSGSVGTAALDAGYAAVEIAIGITVGLSVSALCVYPFRKTKGKSGIFSF